MQNIKLEEVSTGTKWWEKPINRNNVIIEESINHTNTIVNHLSNPNILYNGGFNINQREQTQYTENLKYTVDRWELINVNNVGTTSIGVMNVGNGYIELEGMGDRQLYIQQHMIEEAPPLGGNSITLSVDARVENMTDGYVFFQVGYRPQSGNDVNEKITVDKSKINSTWNRYSVTTNLPDNITRIWVQIGSFNDPDTGYLPVNTNCKMHFRNAKLEIGDTITPYHPRPVGEELALCQRYYEEGFIFGNYMGVIPYQSFHCPFKVVKRIVPTVEYEDPDVSSTKVSAEPRPIYQDAHNCLVPSSVGTSGVAYRFKVKYKADAEVY